MATLDSPSDTPSINPSHAAAAPIVARNAGMTVVAISCDQSLKSDASPMPSTVRFSQAGRARAGPPTVADAGGIGEGGRGQAPPAGPGGLVQGGWVSPVR